MVHHEILPTPTIKAGQGVWTFYGETTIQAPAQVVYEALRDFSSYSKWNLYTPTIDTPSGTNAIQVGDMITLHFRAEPSDKIMEVPCQIVSFSDSDFTLCWRGCTKGIPHWALLAEKVHEVVSKGENECLLKVYETQMGPMAYVVKWTMGEKLMGMARGVAEGLKGYVEG